MKSIRKIKFKFTLIIILIIVISLLSFALKAQIIERQLISSTGNLSKTSNFQISSTSGEIAVSTETSGTIILTQGFQQPLEEDFVGTFSVNNTNIELSIYPNPTNSTIKIDLNSTDLIELKIKLINLNGDLIFPIKKINLPGKISKTINLQQFPASSYILLLENKKGEIVKSFKILKTD